MRMKPLEENGTKQLTRVSHEVTCGTFKLTNFITVDIEEFTGAKKAVLGRNLLVI
jgi:hypothetical protein